MLKKINKAILVGSGGHARVMLEILEMTGKYEIVGIIDPRLEADSIYKGIRVLGDDTLLPRIKLDGIMNAYVGVGSIKDNTRRNKLYDLVKDSGFYLPPVIHPRAIVSETETVISEGVQVMAGAIIQAGTVIGENTIINTGAIIEHDCILGKNIHICPGTVICGGSRIMDNSFIGAGSTVIQGIEIGKNTIIGAGVVIKKNVEEGCLVKGLRS